MQKDFKTNLLDQLEKELSEFFTKQPVDVRKLNETVREFSKILDDKIKSPVDKETEKKETRYLICFKNKDKFPIVISESILYGLIDSIYEMNELNSDKDRLLTSYDEKTGELFVIAQSEIALITKETDWNKQKD